VDNLLVVAKNSEFDFIWKCEYDKEGKKVVHNSIERMVRMQISIKPAAVTYLKDHVNQDQRLFLALDDGSSKYSKLGGSCAIGNKYQLVVADEDDQDYALPLDNEAGFKLTTGDPETDYFGSGLTLDFKNASLALRDDSGILDGAVTLNKDAALPQNDAQRRDDMTKLGGKIC
jgi:hypothetical protein